MKTLLTFIFICIFASPHFAQLLLNGDLTLGTLFWGCSPETNAETTYGGSNGLNSVAEVDALAGLCQTVSGLTPGTTYALSFFASRRTGGCPSPSVTNVDITVSGVLATTVTRTNTTFGLTLSGFLFKATATSHDITFAGGSGFGGSSCGLIIDNISVNISGLPIQLVEFNGISHDAGITLKWATATENNNDHFEVERSKNGVDFELLASLPSKATSGNSVQGLDYSALDDAPFSEHLNYYRLKQVDNTHMASYSKIIAVPFHSSAPDISVYPNPSNGQFSVRLSAKVQDRDVTIAVVGALGKVLFKQNYSPGRSGTIAVDLNEKINPGHYYCVVSTHSASKHFPVVIH